MIRSALFLATSLALAPQEAQIAAVHGGHDAERAAWRYRRAVLPRPAAAPFAAVPLPPEITPHCQGDLRDLRLVGPDGHEIPYVVERLDRREAPQRWAARLIDVRREKKSESRWVMDLEQPRTFDAVSFEVPQRDFAKGLKLEVSDDAQAWRMLKPDAGLFERAWTPPVRHTTVALDQPVSARYVRVTVDDRRSAPIDITGAAALATERLPGRRWSRPAMLTLVSTEGGFRRYRLGAAPGLDFDRLQLVVRESAFSRRVRVTDVRQINERRQETLLGDGVLYRLRLGDEALSGESLALDLRPPAGGELLVEIQDLDSPALREPSAIVSGPQVRLLVPDLDGPATLYYGNSATRASSYDLAALEARLRRELDLPAAEVGAEAENPQFAPPPPLAFVAAQGAPVSPGQWRFVRRVLIAGQDDLYALRLAAADLALLRRDLGDLRIADREDRQVPYILEPHASEERVVLVLARETPPRPSVSRYRLSLPDTDAYARDARLPVAAIELDTAETFFSRPVRLTAPSDTPRREERVLFAGTLSRSTRDGAPAPLLLPLHGEPLSVIRIEIDEGDNAPLALREARAVVKVPRVVFKARAAEYRLLLGNPRGETPRYDLATLRHEVLSYSAVSAQAPPAEPNPAFRRRAGDYFRAAPPSIVLWAAIVAAVLALLYLTLRILRQPPSQGAPPPSDPEAPPG